MKFHKPPSTSAAPRLIDALMGLVLIAALAWVGGAIPFVFSFELSRSDANNPALQGEAGLWSAFGEKDAPETTAK